MLSIAIGAGVVVVAGVYVAAFALCRAAAHADALMEVLNDERTIAMHDLPTDRRPIVLHPTMVRTTPLRRSTPTSRPRRSTKTHRATPNVCWSVLHDEVLDPQ